MMCSLALQGGWSNAKSELLAPQFSTVTLTWDELNAATHRN
jgi:hypothetical protein